MGSSNEISVGDLQLCERAELACLEARLPFRCSVPGGTWSGTLSVQLQGREGREELLPQTLRAAVKQHGTEQLLEGPAPAGHCPPFVGGQLLFEPSGPTAEGTMRSESTRQTLREVLGALMWELAEALQRRRSNGQPIAERFLQVVVRATDQMLATCTRESLDGLRWVTPFRAAGLRIRRDLDRRRYISLMIQLMIREVSMQASVAGDIWAISGLFAGQLLYGTAKLLRGLKDGSVPCEPLPGMSRPDDTLDVLPPPDISHDISLARASRGATTGSEGYEAAATATGNDGPIYQTARCISLPVRFVGDTWAKCVIRVGVLLCAIGKLLRGPKTPSVRRHPLSGTSGPGDTLDVLQLPDIYQDASLIRASCAVTGSEGYEAALTATGNDGLIDRIALQDLGLAKAYASKQVGQFWESFPSRSVEPAHEDLRELASHARVHSLVNFTPNSPYLAANLLPVPDAEYLQAAQAPLVATYLDPRAAAERPQCGVKLPSGEWRRLLLVAAPLRLSLWPCFYEDERSREPCLAVNVVDLDIHQAVCRAADDGCLGHIIHVVLELLEHGPRFLAASSDRCLASPTSRWIVNVSR